MHKKALDKLAAKQQRDQRMVAYNDMAEMAMGAASWQQTHTHASTSAPRPGGKPAGANGQQPWQQGACGGGLLALAAKAWGVGGEELGTGLRPRSSRARLGLCFVA